MDRDYAELLARYRTALLTTRGEDGHLRSRPMAMRQRVRGEEIWFATAISSKKVQDLELDAHCALTFFDASSGDTLSISGIGEVIRDRKLTRELWEASWQRWFPEGPEQRDLALLRVIPEHVERHEGGSGRSEVLFSEPRRQR